MVIIENERKMKHNHNHKECNATTSTMRKMYLFFYQEDFKRVRTPFHLNEEKEVYDP